MSNTDYWLWHFNISNNKKPVWRDLYYYNGNFYYPLSGIPVQVTGLIKRKIRIFTKKNGELIKQDRNHSDYKTKLQLAIEQGL